MQRHRRPEQIAAQLFRSRAIRGRHPDVGQGGRMDPVGIAGVEPAAFEQALYPAGRSRQHNAETHGTLARRSDQGRGPRRLVRETARGGLRILRLAIETHLVTSHHLLPLLIDWPGGLLVEVTDGTTDFNASRHRISVFYDLAKVTVNRLAFSQGHELARHGGTAVAITPGWLRSEMMLDNFGITEENWRDAVERGKTPPDFALSESPRYVGRAVAALAADPDRNRWNHQSVSSAQLARA